MPSTGISQYLEYGLGATADTYAGRVTGGEIRKETNLVWRPSVGGKHAPGRSGVANIGGSATIEIADKTLLNYFTRASYTAPSLTALTFEGATMGDIGYGWTQTGCYINGLNVDLAVGEPLTATIDWLALDEAANAAPSVPTQSATHFEWYEGECTIGGTTYKLQRLGFAASNGCQAISSIENKTTNALALPESIVVGKFTCTVTAEVLSRPSTSMWDLHEDALPVGVGAVVQCTGVTGGHVITFTLKNLAGRSARMPYTNDDGLVVFALDLEAEPNASDSLTIDYT